MFRVFLPSQLESYTGGVRELTLNVEKNEAGNLALRDIIQALDARYPGLAFRIVTEQQQIRPHVAIFIGEKLVRELDAPLLGGERLQIVGALSGG